MWSAENNLSYKQNQHIRNNIYCNHSDTFVDIPRKIRYEKVECQQTEPCRPIKESLGYSLITVLGTKY